MMKPGKRGAGRQPDEQALQDVALHDLEDMRTALLHEIQDGSEGEDEKVEVLSRLAVCAPRQAANRALARRTDPAPKD